MTRQEDSTRPTAAATVVAIALALDMFLYGAIIPILPELPAVDGSAMLSGVLFAVYAAAQLVTVAFVGRAVDRIGPRRPFQAGILGVAAATLLFGVATTVPGTAGLVLLILGRAAQGVAAAISWTAGLALVAAVYPAERRGQAMGLTLSAVGIGVLLGPAVSGQLAGWLGPAAPFHLIAVFAVGDAIARFLLIKVDHRPPVEVPFRTVARGPRAGLLITLTAIGAAALAYLEPVLPLHLDDLGVGAGGIGSAFAGAALAGVLSSPLGGGLTDRLGPNRVVAIGAFIVAAGFALAGRDSTALAVTGLIVVGFGAQLLLAPTLVLIGRLAEHQRPPAYGVAYALYNLAYTAGLTVAPLAAGLLGGLAGITGATVGAAIAAGALAVVMSGRR
ncbi:MFS transporter [Actinoplanes sichuanensis]|uniref:MFS transporter n=1 Tax=Actinoplanes sichuanensis TaxID=512349 RepID=A0ABW4A1N1_9ACTN|nr:MFS transporter [Actinoplanes sichuanensis]BEL01871.1 MFS transporter [Actinoplanes sichuanensis]